MKCRWCGEEITEFEDGPLYIREYGEMKYYHVNGIGFCKDESGGYIRMGDLLVPAQKSESAEVVEILKRYGG